MTRYVLVYEGTAADADMSGASPEEMKAMMDAWGAWYGSMGAALVDGGAPFSVSSAVNSGGASDDAGNLTGYTIVEAADMAAAQAIAAGCPVVEGGLTVRIYECVVMPEMG